MVDASILKLNMQRRRLLMASMATLVTAAPRARANDAPIELPRDEVPFVVTPPRVVQRMLAMAEVNDRDTLVDLGSGDGRIVIAAAQRGARAHGFEIDPQLVALSRARAKAARVERRTAFRVQDIFTADYRGYSVVTMYLLPEFNLKLRPKLLKELAPGARIVSHEWDMGEWQPDETLSVANPTKLLGRDFAHKVMLWVVPARLAGHWRVEGFGEPFLLDIAQQFQMLTISAARGNVRAAQLRGRDLEMIWHDGTRTWRLSGRLLDNGELRGVGGSIAVERGDQRWRAVRASG